MSSLNIYNDIKNNPNKDIPISGLTVDYSNTPLISYGEEIGVRGYGFTEKTGFVVVLDALGIKGMWRKMTPIQIIQKWQSIRNSFIASIKQYNNIFFRALSDTIIITIDDIKGELLDFVFNLIKNPFMDSIKTGIFLRGVISFGQYYLSDPLIIGPSLDDAAYHHDKTNWIGVSLSPTLCNIIDFTNCYTSNFIFYENIPHKEKFYNGPVLCWPLYDSNQECISRISSERQMINDKNILKKYDNTIAFYNRCLDIRQSYR